MGPIKDKNTMRQPAKITVLSMGAYDLALIRNGHIPREFNKIVAFCLKHNGA